MEFLKPHRRVCRRHTPGYWGAQAFFLFVVCVFLPDVHCITTVANGNKQKSLSPPSDDVHEHQEELVSSRLDAIYEDGLKRVAKFEKVAKPLYENSQRLNERILVKNSTTMFLVHNKINASNSSRSPYLFHKNAKKKKIGSKMYEKLGIDKRNQDIEKMAQMNAEIDDESATEVEGFEKLKPDSVTRRVLVFKLRIARSLKADLVSQFNVADDIRQKIEGAKKSLESAMGSPICQQSNPMKTRNTLFLEQQRGRQRATIPPNVDDIIAGVEHRLKKKLGAPCNTNDNSGSNTDCVEKTHKYATEETDRLITKIAGSSLRGEGLKVKPGKPWLRPHHHQKPAEGIWAKPKKECIDNPPSLEVLEFDLENQDNYQVDLLKRINTLINNVQELYSIETKAEIVRNATHLMKERIQEEHNREILYIKRKKEYSDDTY